MREKVKVFVNQSNLVVRNLEDLNNVDISGIADGAFLIYNETTNKYEFTTNIVGEGIIIDGGAF